MLQKNKSIFQLIRGLRNADYFVAMNIQNNKTYISHE
jgi:hypothetical protein